MRRMIRYVASEVRHKQRDSIKRGRTFTQGNPVMTQFKKQAGYDKGYGNVLIQPGSRGRSYLKRDTDGMLQYSNASGECCHDAKTRTQSAIFLHFTYSRSGHLQ